MAATLADLTAEKRADCSVGLMAGRWERSMVVTSAVSSAEQLVELKAELLVVRSAETMAARLERN